MSLYIVTGGAGFIGSHLTAHLQALGHQVRVLDLITGGASEERAQALQSLSGVTLIRGDIRNPETCREVCRNADFVLHHAAEPSVPRSIDNPAACIEINVGGAVNMLTAARQAGTVRRFVFASSCAVYGDTPGAAKRETDTVRPLSPYATSKLAVEYLCANFTHLHGLETVCLRYFNVYGPGQDPAGAYAAVIPQFITHIVKGTAPWIEGDGEQSRDFVAVGDVVAANLLAGEAEGVAGQVFNIGSGRKTSLNQLLDRLGAIAGNSVAPLTRPARVGDIRHSCADISRARECLGYVPATSLEEGLARAMHWYHDRYARSL